MNWKDIVYFLQKQLHWGEQWALQGHFLFRAVNISVQSIPIEKFERSIVAQEQDDIFLRVRPETGSKIVSQIKLLWDINDRPYWHSLGLRTIFLGSIVLGSFLKSEPN